jgi:hypothetical protein
MNLAFRMIWDGGEYCDIVACRLPA